MADRNVKVSIIVIGYNATNQIRKCLESIIYQTYNNLEIICVDDGSTDDTSSIYNYYAKMDKRVKVIVNSYNKGCVGARCAGLNEATGKYLMFIDSDDYYKNNAIERIINCIDDNIDVCEFGTELQFIGDGLSDIQKEDFQKYYLFIKGFDFTNRDLLDLCFDKNIIKVNVWNKIYKTEIVKEALECYNDEYVVLEEDWLINYMILNWTKTYKQINEKLIVHNIGEGVSTPKIQKSQKDTINTALAYNTYNIICEWSKKCKLLNEKTTGIIDIIKYRIGLIVVSSFAYDCKKEYCRLFMDNLLKYCSINDFLIFLTNAIYSGKIANKKEVIDKLFCCDFKSKIIREYIRNLSCEEQPTELMARDEFVKCFYNSTTWKIGSFFTIIPRKIKDFILRKNINIKTTTATNKSTSIIENPFINVINNYPIRLDDMNFKNFLGFRNIIYKDGGKIINEKELLHLEYTKTMKILLITDNILSNTIKNIILYCQSKDYKLLLLTNSINETPNYFNNYKIPVLCDDKIDRNVLDNYITLFDGYIKDFNDDNNELFKYKNGVRKSLIATDKPLVLSDDEKYIYRTETDFEKYFDFMLYSKYMNYNNLISVIIPALNAGKEIEQLFNSIESQKCVLPPEVIIIDSGSSDNTVDIAKKHNAKVLQISNEEFSHSNSRNMAASIAKGEYLMFTTQDAIPQSDLTFARLLKKIEDNQAAAITCMEECKEDADLYARTLVYYYKKDYFVDLPDEIILNYDGKKYESNYANDRRYSSLDNVMTLTKRDIFDKYKFRQDYGEDCDYGLRLYKDGYMLVKTADTKVIHSHNRSPFYFLRRSYVDIINMKKIYTNMPIRVGNINNFNNLVLNAYIFMFYFRDSLLTFKSDTLIYEMLIDHIYNYFEINNEKIILCTNEYVRQCIVSDSYTDKEFLSLCKNINNACDSFEIEISFLIELLCIFMNHVLLLFKEKNYNIDFSVDTVSKSIEKYTAGLVGTLIGQCSIIHYGQNKKMDLIIDSINKKI